MATKNAVPKIGLRASSNRTLMFGFVSVGVALAPALDAKARIAGKYRDPDTLGPVRQVYLNDDGEEVKPVRAFEAEGGFVTLDTDDVERVEGDGVIKLVANIDAAEVPTEWITSTHLAWPTDTSHDERYALLANYLRANGRALVGTTAANGTTKTLIVRWSDTYDCLVCQYLAFHAQVRWGNVEKIADAVAKMPAPDPAMAQMAEQVFAMMPDEFEWENVKDAYGEALEAAIAEKAATGSVTVTTAPGVSGAPVDLMAALQASMDAGAGKADTDKTPSDRGGYTRKRKASA